MPEAPDLQPDSDDQRKFEDSLVILGFVKAHLVYAANVLARHSVLETATRPPNQPERFVEEAYVGSVLVHLWLCAFLEAWDGIAPPDDAARASKKAAAPFVKRIRTAWPDLHAVRSALIAHPPREDGEPVRPWTLLAQVRSPSSFAEWLLLAGCAIDAHWILVQRHREAFDRAQKRFTSYRGPLAVRGIGTLGEAVAEIARLRAEVSEVERAQDRSPTDFPGLPPFLDAKAMVGKLLGLP